MKICNSCICSASIRLPCMHAFTCHACVLISAHAQKLVFAFLGTSHMHSFSLNLLPCQQSHHCQSLMLLCTAFALSY